MCRLGISLLSNVLFLGWWSVSYASFIFPYGIVTASGNDGYTYIGKTLQLNCTLNSTLDFTAEDLIFSFENADCESGSCDISKDLMTILNNHTLQLNHRIIDAQDSGEYICWIEPTEQMVNSLIVAVQYPPQEVNVTCIVIDWDVSLTCILEYGVLYIDNSAVIEINSPEMSVEANLMTLRSRSPCPQQISPFDGISQCVWNDFRAAPKYLLMVIIKNKITGNQSQTLFCIDTHKIVKPSPVNHIWLEKRTSTCLTLAWNHTRIHRDKYYRISASNGVSQIVSNNSAQFCGLLPFTEYKFSVECHASISKTDLCPEKFQKDPEDFWSEARNMTVITAESVPDRSFLIIPGSYSLGRCDEKNRTRDVIVFMNAVPRDQQHGEIIGYRYIYNGTAVDVDIPSPTVAIIPGVSCNMNISVRIFSRTKAGASRKNAQLQIFADDDQFVSGFAVKILQNSLVAVWDNSTTREDGGNVTVFWCWKDKTKLEKICQGGIKGTSAPYTAGQVEIPQLLLSIDGWESPYSVLYGISRNGRAISWTDCLFSWKAQMKPPKVSVKAVNEQLLVLWNIQECSEAYQVHTKGIIIYYCIEQNCEDSNRSVKINGLDSNSYSLHGNPGQKYAISVQAEDYLDRKSPLSEPQTIVLPMPKASPPWWAVIVSLLLVVVLIVVGCCCYHHVKKMKAKFGPPVLCDAYSSRTGEQEIYRRCELDSPSRRIPLVFSRTSTIETDLTVSDLPVPVMIPADEESVEGVLAPCEDNSQQWPTHSHTGDVMLAQHPVGSDYNSHADDAFISKPITFGEVLRKGNEVEKHGGFMYLPASNDIVPSASEPIDVDCNRDAIICVSSPKASSVIGETYSHTTASDSVIHTDYCTINQANSASTAYNSACSVSRLDRVSPQTASSSYARQADDSRRSDGVPSIMEGPHECAEWQLSDKERNKDHSVQYQVEEESWGPCMALSQPSVIFSPGLGQHTESTATDASTAEGTVNPLSAATLPVTSHRQVEGRGQVELVDIVDSTGLGNNREKTTLAGYIRVTTSDP